MNETKGRAARAQQILDEGVSNVPAVYTLSRWYIEAALELEMLKAENEMAKALLGDVLDGGYGARYGWEDAHDWLMKHSPEFAAKYE